MSDRAPAEQFWEERYGQRERIWSGRPNVFLVDIVGSLTPGTALDLGCGEGADAIWLAQRGWQVTAVDISPKALSRAAEAAAAAGVQDRIDFRQVDLASGVAAGPFDLVSAEFLQTPLEFPRDAVLRSAAAAVSPRGLLLIVEHAAAPPWTIDKSTNSNAPQLTHTGAKGHHDGRFPAAEETFAALQLATEQWHVEILDRRDRQATGPDGQAATFTDNVIAVRRAG